MPSKTTNRPGSKSQTKSPQRSRKKADSAGRPHSAAWLERPPRTTAAPGQQTLAGLAILGVIAAAAVCAYLTLCLLFYQGQWQIVFHPSLTITATPATVGLKYDAISFDYTGTGAAQLTGWWIPADPKPLPKALPTPPEPCSSSTTAAARSPIPPNSSKPSTRSESTSSPSTIAASARASNTHPSETRVYEDADAAWNYLTDIRHLDPRSIILYGTGLGATIAAETALRHHESPALILENPAPPALSLIAADERTSLLPIRWLFRDRFEIGPKLQTLGIELSPAAEAIVLSGRLAPSPEIVRQENPNPSGPKFLLLLGPKPAVNSVVRSIFVP